MTTPVSADNYNLQGQQDDIDHKVGGFHSRFTDIVKDLEKKETWVFSLMDGILELTHWAINLIYERQLNPKIYDQMTESKRASAKVMAADGYNEQDLPITKSA